MDKSAFKPAAKLLHDLFVVRQDAYAVQQADGNYATRKHELNPYRIERMLTNGESLLAYQFCAGMTRWLCLDFDIRKDQLTHEVTHEARLLQIRQLYAVVNAASRRMRELGICHIIEFSGNRGFHVWLFLDVRISQHNAYNILEKIIATLELNNVPPPLVIDKFPRSPATNTKYGFGVKLPLSKHRKSGCYAYLLSQRDDVSLPDNPWITEMDSTFLAEQVGLLASVSRHSPTELSRLLGIPIINTGGSSFEDAQFFRASPSLQTGQSTELSAILGQLSKCNIVSNIVERAKSGAKLSEKERLPIVGLLGRLKADGEAELGQRLLLEFFSTLPDYDPEKTESKLASLKLYPPTCAYLRSLFPTSGGCSCKESSAFCSPLDHLAAVDVERNNPFTVSEAEARAILVGQINYTRINDEIALATTLAELESLAPSTTVALCNRTMTINPDLHFYAFVRTEPDNKSRRLVALSARDKLWTTAYMLFLHRFFSAEFSDNSYGYRVQPGFSGGHIFRPWLTQWKAFISKLSDYIFPSSHADCWLLKIDIKSFYSSIDLQRLEVKLHEGPTKAIRALLNSIPQDERERYRLIATTLKNACKQVEEGANVGLPQGPAFARYLAEVFLLDFDQLVEQFEEQGLVCYARYVDDIFVILEPHCDLAAIERTVIEYLRTLGLELNYDKHFSGRVKEYRAKFLDYKQETKYIVDQVSRRFRSSSRAEIEEASNILLELVTGEFGEGIQSEHLNFLYTHLPEDAITEDLKKNCASHVLQLTEGRGSFFANFFSFYLENTSRFEESDLRQLGALSGLRREVFLNALLTRFLRGDVPQPLYTPIAELVAGFAANCGSHLERELLACLMVVEPALSQAALWGSVPEAMLLRVLGHPIRKQVPDLLLTVIRDALLRLPVQDFVLQLYAVVFSCSVSRASHEVLCKLFVDRVLESLGISRPESQRLSFLPDDDHDVEQLHDKYYQLCCLMSVGRPDLVTEKLGALWKSLVASYNRVKKIVINGPLWLGKLSEVSISTINCNAIIAASLDDGFLPGEPDAHQLFTTYHEYLALYLLAPDSTQNLEVPEGSAEERRRKLLSSIDDKAAPFLRWIVDENPGQLYPNRGECLENIIRNDMMVLRRGDQLLVRMRSDVINRGNFSYLSMLTLLPERIMDSRYAGVIFQYATLAYQSISVALGGCHTLSELIDKALEIKRNAVVFGGDSQFPGYINIFATDARIDLDGRPLVPYTALCDFLISTQRSGASDIVMVRQNNMVGLLAGVLDWVRSTRMKLLPFEHPYNMNGNELIESFSQQEDHAAVVRNLEYFSEELGKVKRPNMFDIEYCRAAAMYGHVVDGDGARVGAIEVPVAHAFLQQYLRSRRRGDYRLLLLLDATAKPEDKDLSAIYSTVCGSIERFVAGLGHPAPTLPIARLLREELEGILAAVRTCLDGEDGEVRAEEFIRRKLTIDRETGDVCLDDEVVLKRGTNGASDDSCFLCDPAIGISRFEPLSTVFEGRIARGTADVCSFTRDKRRFLVVIGGALIASVERIGSRYREVEAMGRAGSEFQSLKSYYLNSRKDEDAIRDSADFCEASRVLTEHHQCDISVAEVRLIRWLLCFPVQHHPALLSVVRAHEVIGYADRETFIQTLAALQMQGNVFFSIKRYDDLNGTHRLLQFSTQGQNIIRELRLHEFVEDILKNKRGGKIEKIVILADICISGSQIADALRNYYLAAKLNSARRFHHIDEGRFGEFKEKLRAVSRIHFVFAVYTDEAEKRLRSVVKEVFNISGESVLFSGRRVMFSECTLINNPRISVASQTSFRSLIQDIETIAGIFDMNDERTLNDYTDSLTEKYIASVNIVARQNSMSKRCAKIFTLTPFDRSAQPLFNHIREHGS